MAVVLGSVFLMAILLGEGRPAGPVDFAVILLSGAAIVLSAGTLRGSDLSRRLMILLLLLAAGWSLFTLIRALAETGSRSGLGFLFPFLLFDALLVVTSVGSFLLLRSRTVREAFRRGGKRAASAP
jgi:hypothetical protein